MPTYQRFESLPVWQAAAALYERIESYLASALPPVRPFFRDQLARAALSVSNNIAEGCERGTTNELLAKHAQLLREGSAKVGREIAQR